MLYSTIYEMRNRFPGKAALLGDRIDLTYDEIFNRSDALAAGLRRHGARSKSRVFIVHQSGVNLLPSVLAALQAGCYAIPVDPRDSISLAVEKNAGRNLPLVITDTATLAVTQELHTYPKDALVILEVTELRRDRAEQDLKAERRRTPGPLESGAIVFRDRETAGKTGGIVYDDDLLIRLMSMQAEQDELRKGLREYIPSTLLHAFPFLQLLACMSAGGTAIVSEEEPNAANLTARVNQNRCNALAVPMETLRQYMEDTEALPASIAAQIRLITVDDPSLSVTEKKRILKRFPNAHLRLIYGRSEAPLVSWIDYRTQHERIQTIGRPADPEEVLVRDDRGHQPRRGEAGEIVVRGKSLASGYLLGDERAPLLPAGAVEFRTGDIGFVDAKGYLCYLGRKDEIITRGHRKIAPQQIEEQLREAYPECEICVIGIPAPEGESGEIPVLCYSAKNGETIIPSQLSAILSKRIDRTLIPRVVFRIASLPRTANGISRHALKNMILEGSSIT